MATTTHSNATCPRCRSKSTGRFCVNCGAVLNDARCATCGGALSAGTRFCGDCGMAVGASIEGAPSAGRAARALRWGIPLTALVLLAGVAVAWGSRAQRADAPVGAVTGTAAGGGGAAADLAAMSPQERASRLFDRVMRYGEAGQLDSARFFAPMAIQSYEMLGTPDAHARYDIGMIAAMTGDSARARAEADTILTKRSTHLLGLALAMRMARNAGTRARYAKRLLAAEAAESAGALPEYVEHRNDIQRSVADAKIRTP
jgi:hypothetical protein